jgi:predicted membrane protein
MSIEKHQIIDVQAITEGRDEGGNALDVRIFNWICLIVVCIGIAAGILNLVVNNPAIEFFYCLAAIFVGGLSWYFSTQHQLSKHLTIPLVLFFLILLSGAWLTNQGHEGSTPYYLFIFFNAVIIISPATYRWFLFVFVLSSIFTLYIVTNSDPTLVSDYISSNVRFWDVAISFFACIILSGILMWLVVREYETEKEKNERLIQRSLDDKARLEQLLSEISVLKGILPVCSFCKKIKDENDQWQSMEYYISSHSEAQFSHGFCPECGKEHYED